MTLKAYSFERVTATGAMQNCYITFDSQSLNWNDREIFVAFKNFSSVDESQRKIVRLGRSEPENIATRQAFILRLSGNEFLAQAMSPISAGDTGKPFLLYFSDRIWQMALNTPFISDFSQIDGNENRIEVLKPLGEMNPILHEIELN